MRRFWILVGVVAAVVVVAAAGVLAVRSQVSPPPARSGAAACSPRPCVDAGGYRMNVTSVERGDGIVRVTVRFRVSGLTNMHAEPVDFTLRRDGTTYRPWFDAGAGCAAWPRTQIPDGASLGPKVVCFRPAATSGRLTLNWDPDLGISEYFSSGYDLTLS